MGSNAQAFNNIKWLPKGSPRGLPKHPSPIFGRESPNPLKIVEIESNKNDISSRKSVAVEEVITYIMLSTRTVTIRLACNLANLRETLLARGARV
jgi:hypothetical protein